MGWLKPNIDKLVSRRDVAGLVRALHHSDITVRLRATYSLGQLGDAGAVEPLAAMLDDVSRDVQFVAATALASLGDHRGVGLLVEGASDPAASVRLVCAELLGALRDAAGTDALVGLLADESLDVRHAATASLGRLRGSVVTGALITALADTARRSAALEALAEHPRPARDRALRLVACDPALAGLRTGRAARSLAAASADTLLSLLGDDDPSTRAGAAELVHALAGSAEPERSIAASVEGLEQRADVEALLTLGSCTESPSSCFGPQLRQRVVEALGRLGDPRATDVVAQQLEPRATDRESEADRRCTQAALEVLPKLWEADELRAAGKHAVQAALGAPDRHHAVATALAEIGDTTAVHLLLEAVEQHPELRGQMQPLLAQVHDLVALTDGLRSTRAPVSEMTATVLERVGVEATQPLADFVRQESGAPKLRAVEVLADIGDGRAVEPLLDVLSSAPNDGELAWTAAAGLVARGRVKDVVDQLERSGSASTMLKLINERPKALDAELLTRAGRTVISNGDLARGYGSWPEVEHLLTKRVPGGHYLFDGAQLHDIGETWLRHLESIESPHWGELSEWGPLHKLLDKRLDAFDERQLQRVIDLHPIECEVWGGDEREMGGAFTTYDPEPMRQLAKAEIRRRGRSQAPAEP